MSAISDNVIMVDNSVSVQTTLTVVLLTVCSVISFQFVIEVTTTGLPVKHSTVSFTAETEEALMLSTMKKEFLQLRFNAVERDVI